jgi:bifunctional UDP-N-acetylglucosamine pyrophosphorylase / glucosamine-1-phosphate N-acetyltransferase
VNTAARRRWVCLVLAAGKGTRMNSDLAKVLHEIDGRSLLGHVLDTAARLPLGRTVVVVGHQAEEVKRRHASAGLEFALQEPQLGTGHAAMVAVPLLEDEGPDADCLVLYGDVPLLRVSTLDELMERHRIDGNGVTVLTAEVADPRGYGRIVRDGDGRFLRITEDRDLAPGERGIREINSGIYAFRLGPLREALGLLRADNAQREYYLTDALTLIRNAGLPVGVFLLADPEEISGINTPGQLAEAAAVLARRRADPAEGCAACALLARDDLVLERRDGMVLVPAPRPYNSGHLWIVPDRHFVSWESLDAEMSVRLLDFAADAERWLEEAYHPHAFNLGYNSGAAGEHLVLQIAPRWTGDANFMPLFAGVSILPETPEGTRRRILECRARLAGAAGDGDAGAGAGGVP